MKKTYFALFLALFINLQSFCNPLPPPDYLKISEFVFNSDNTWTLELVDSFLQDYSPFSYCDSLFICSSTGRAKVINFQENNQCYPYQVQVVITQDDILSPLHINEEGDSITIVHFCCNERDDLIPKTVLTFGNYPNAMIGKPAEGQSIVAVSSGYWNSGAYCYNYYSKNNKPSLGNCDKDENYMCGTLQGKIYDKNGLPLCNQSYIFFNGNEAEISYKTTTDDEGNYNLKVFANTLTLYAIYVKTSPYYFIKYDEKGAIDLVQLDIEVGDVIDLDIHVISDIVSSPEVKISSNPVKIYPNPVKKGSLLNYEIDLPVLAANVEMEVLSLTGQLLLREKITDKTGVIDLQKEIPAGIYILNCRMNRKNLYSTRIVIAE